jgi:hypothetical protein
MAYYDALIAKWATLTGTTGDKLAALNALTVPGPIIDVPISAVVSYLALSGKLFGLSAYASAPPAGSNSTAIVAAKELVSLIASPNAGPFRMSIPSVYSGVHTFLDALVADPNTGITSADEASILALAQPLIPWWKANGYPGALNQYDLQAAGDLT